MDLRNLYSHPPSFDKICQFSWQCHHLYQTTCYNKGANDQRIIIHSRCQEPFALFGTLKCLEKKKELGSTLPTSTFAPYSPFEAIKSSLSVDLVFALVCILKLLNPTFGFSKPHVSSVTLGGSTYRIYSWLVSGMAVKQ